MSVYTFDNNFIDLYYELNDIDISNDILLLEGIAGSEQLIRAYDPVTIAKYGPRSKRVTRPLVVNQATGEDFATYNLDRYKEPVASIVITLIGDESNLIIKLLSLKISDKVTVIGTQMGLSADFVIDTMELSMDNSSILQASYQLSGLRAGE